MIKFQVQSLFQRFLNRTLCVFSQMQDIKHIRRDCSVALVMPLGWDLGVLGVKNMVMWQIKLNRMISRPGYTEKFYLKIKLVTLG